MQITRNHGVYDLFDANYLSCKMGKMKPNSDIYVDMLRDLKATPNEVVFIDDKEENVAAARRLNFRAIKYNRPNQLSNDLEKNLFSNID